jgi:hypothetical protein
VSNENKFTKAELVEMWKRPVDRQYNVAISKMLEAIIATKGDITLCFSGGKDSTLLADMYCELICKTPFKDIPVKLAFANTTNETSANLEHVASFIGYLKTKYGVSIDFKETLPKIPWAKFVKERGIPLISKEQAKAIRHIKNDMRKTGCDYETIIKLSTPNIKSVRELKDIGFSNSGILSLTGYVSSRDSFGKKFVLSKKWQPMLLCEVDLTELCCLHVKEMPLDKLEGNNRMSGEQAIESARRTDKYLQTGCNTYLPDGGYKSKPFGSMTTDGILYALQYRKTPMCADYGSIIKTEDGYRCTKAQRTGCALCGFGCQYDTERFVRLQETEPAKVKFAFKPKSEGGAGFKEAIEHMNEYCGTKVIIPQI